MSTAFVLLLVVLLASFLLGLPLGYSMLSAGLLFFLVGGIDLGNAASLMMNGLYSKFILIAIPMFIFSAQVMNNSTVTTRLFDFAYAMVGRMHGGLAQVNVLNSVMFSGMSGSAVADASGNGQMEIKVMRERGYSRGFAAATSAATATIGPIIPPSIPMVIYAYLSGASVGMLFAGGMVPGLLLAAMMMVLIRFLATRHNFERGTWLGLRNLFARFIASMPALLTSVIMLGGIYTGAFTPTEAAGVAALYAILLAVIGYRTVGAKKLWQIVGISTKQSAQVLLMIVGAFLLNYAIAIERIPNAISDWLLNVTNSAIVLLILINVIFLIAGMFIDTSIMLLIMVPLILPALMEAGVDPVHFGVTIVLNMMIGLSTPPFGLLLFVVSSVNRIPLREVIREIWWYILSMLAVLWVLVFFPEIVLFIPRLLGYIPVGG